MGTFLLVQSFRSEKEELQKATSLLLVRMAARFDKEMRYMNMQQQQIGSINLLCGYNE
jgi:hypothetical protein